MTETGYISVWFGFSNRLTYWPLFMVETWAKNIDTAQGDLNRRARSTYVYPYRSIQSGHT